MDGLIIYRPYKIHLPMAILMSVFSAGIVVIATLHGMGMGKNFFAWLAFGLLMWTASAGGFLTYFDTVCFDAMGFTVREAWRFRPIRFTWDDYPYSYLDAGCYGKKVWIISPTALDSKTVKRYASRAQWSLRVVRPPVITIYVEPVRHGSQMEELMRQHLFNDASNTT